MDSYDPDLLHVQKNRNLTEYGTLQEEHKIKFYCGECERSWTSAKGVTVFEYETWDRYGKYGDAVNV